MRPGVSLFAALALGAVAACSFDFGFDGTRYRCGAGERCPSGQTCVGGVCSPEPDAAADADDGGPPSSVCGNLTLLQDSFDVGGTGPFFSSFADPGVTVGEGGGQLVIDLNANIDGYAGYDSTYFYDLHGGSIDLAVAEVTGALTILEVRNHLGNVAQVAHQNGNIYAGIFNVAGEGTLAQRAWNPAERFWRIREADGMMSWELSTDRQIWNDLHRRALPFDVSHVRGIVSAGATAPLPSRARFDDLNLAAPSAPYCPAAELRDDFAASPLGPTWEPYTNTGCTIAESGGNLVMTYSSGVGNVFCGMTSLHLWDLSRGDGLVVDGMAFPSLTNFVGYLQAAVPGTGSANRIETTLDGTQFEYRVYVNDAATDQRSMVIDRVLHRWWRMRGDGAVAIFETSTDKVSWTERFRSTVPFPLSPLEVNLGAGHYGNIGGIPLTMMVPGINAD